MPFPCLIPDLQIDRVTSHDQNHLDTLVGRNWGQLGVSRKQPIPTTATEAIDWRTYFDSRSVASWRISVSVALVSISIARWTGGRRWVKWPGNFQLIKILDSACLISCTVLHNGMKQAIHIHPDLRRSKWWQYTQSSAEIINHILLLAVKVIDEWLQSQT